MTKIEIKEKTTSAELYCIEDMPPGTVFIHHGYYLIRGNDKDSDGYIYATNLEDGYMYLLAPKSSFQVVSKVTMEVTV